MKSYSDIAMSTTTTTQAGDIITRDEIITRCNRSPKLIMEFAARGIAIRNPNVIHSDDQIEWMMSDTITAALTVIDPDRVHGILPEMTKYILKLQGRQQERAKFRSESKEQLQDQFFSRMLTQNQVVHPALPTRPREDPLVEFATKYLLSKQNAGGEIPELIDKRANPDWVKAEKKAQSWGHKVGMSTKEACKEIVPAIIAVYVATNGNYEQAKPLAEFLVEEKKRFQNDIGKMSNIELKL